jgi:protein TonB
MQIRFARFIWGGTIVQRAAVELVCSIVLITLGFAAVPYAMAGQAASDPAAVRVGGDVKPPMKVKDVKPVYPEVARQTRTQGAVILDLTIGADGKVKSVKVVKSLALLDAAAMNAAKEWEFKPTLVNGKATPVIMTTSVIFKLD